MTTPTTDTDPNHVGLDDQPPFSARPAGFWIRLVALFIDTAILLIILSPISILSNSLAPLGNTSEFNEDTIRFLTIFSIALLLQSAITIGYSLWFLHKKGATPGKMALSLKVIDEDTSENLSYGKIILRELVGKQFVLPMLCFIFWLPIWLMVFRKDRRCIHDLIGNSRVVYSKQTASI